MSEKVAVFPRELLEKHASKFARGLTEYTTDAQELLRIIGPHVTFMERDEAEISETHVQIATYCVVARGVPHYEVFAYRRTVKAGENRLHGKLSVGIGGHVEEQDFRMALPWQVSLEVAVDIAAMREIREELCIPAYDGLLNNPSTLIYHPVDAVGRMHLGVLYTLKVEVPETVCSDESIERARFYPEAELERMVGEMESWSALVTSSYCLSRM